MEGTGISKAWHMETHIIPVKIIVSWHGGGALQRRWRVAQQTVLLVSIVFVIIVGIVKRAVHFLRVWDDTTPTARTTESISERYRSPRRRWARPRPSRERRVWSHGGMKECDGRLDEYKTETCNSQPL